MTKRALWVGLGLAGCMAVTGATAAEKTAAAAAAPLGAEQIVERSIAASGGAQAWHAVNAMVMSGQIEAGGKKNATLPFVLTMKRPKKSRFEVRFEGQSAFQVYDGAQGWKVRPFLGRDEVDPYTPAEAKSAADAAELDGLLVDHAKKGTKVALAGVEKVDGKSAYKLDLTLRDGVQRHMWVDASSFLELKVDGEPRKLDGRMHPVAIYLRDYKTEGGLKVPHVIETEVQGVKPTHKMTIERVSVNPSIDDALFAKPALPTVAKAAAQAR